MADADHTDFSEEKLEDTKKLAGDEAHDVAKTVIEAQKSAEELKQKAADAEEKLKDAHKELTASEDKLKEKAGSATKPTTVAGYPLSELALAPIRPPKPAEETEGDPEAKDQLAEVSEQKKAVEAVAKEITKIKTEAEKFNQQQANATKKLSDVIDENQS